MDLRLKKFAVRIIRLANSLPISKEGKVIANQIIRCGTSVAANYRAAQRSRSDAEFLSKLGIVEEEADETMFWIELIIELNIFEKEMLDPVLREANEITAIIVSSKKKIRQKLKNN